MRLPRRSEPSGPVSLVAGGDDEPYGRVDQAEISGDQGGFVQQPGLATEWVGELADGDAGQQPRG